MLQTLKSFLDTIGTGNWVLKQSKYSDLLVRTNLTEHRPPEQCISLPSQLVDYACYKAKQSSWSSTASTLQKTLKVIFALGIWDSVCRNGT